MRKSGGSRKEGQVSLWLAFSTAVSPGTGSAGNRGAAGIHGSYFAVGITNSAPLPMLSGQRCMTDFCLV